MERPMNGSRKAGSGQNNERKAKVASRASAHGWGVASSGSRVAGLEGPGKRRNTTWAFYR